jgi:5-methylcytosine-specific restriction endonuclease McrA
MCGVELARSAGRLDHRIPVALGGASELSNLWILCDDCDRAKTRDDLALIRRIDRDLERRDHFAK